MKGVNEAGENKKKEELRIETTLLQGISELDRGYTWRSRKKQKIQQKGKKNIR